MIAIDDGSTEGNRQEFGYRPEAPDQPSTTVVVAVAEVTGRDAQALEALSETIDTDALNALFADRPSGEPMRADPTVGFEYESCFVTVAADLVTVVRTR